MQYYTLAKKHHPDAIQGADEKEKEASKELFKQITEAYAVLSDELLRKKYDRLIFGDSAGNKQFDNEEAYQYWSEKGRGGQGARAMNEYEEM